MKMKIAILGSTGSIGKKTFNLILKNKKKFNVVLLSTNKNIKIIFNQAKQMGVKNLIITDRVKFQSALKKNKNNRIKIFNNFDNLNKIFKKKVDYIMSSIGGIDGLSPTISVIKFTKKIAIANKESIICGWNLIEKNLRKNNTKFIPVDSEHFSLWKIINENNKNNIDKIYITASGGPFLNTPLKKLRYVKPHEATKHPNWKMGKKISIDSATLMNKVFEIIEANKIFKIDLKKFNILIHPKSYIHAVVKFKNGLIKIVAHDTDMTIPIANTMFDSDELILKNENIKFEVLNNLKLQLPSYNKYPSLKILNKISSTNTLFESALISINDELVNQFLNNKIRFSEIMPFLFNILKLNKITKSYKKRISSFNQIDEFKKMVTIETVKYVQNIKNQ